MDKHLVNIDELFKQRLVGGEERERSGAWSNMRDLLDKEMPQRKPVAFFWRRAFSVAGALLLLAGATIGSYQYSAYRDRNAANSIVASDAVGSATHAVAAAQAANSELATTQLAASGIAATAKMNNDLSDNTPKNDNSKATIVATAHKYAGKKAANHTTIQTNVVTKDGTEEGLANTTTVKVAAKEETAQRLATTTTAIKVAEPAKQPAIKKGGIRNNATSVTSPAQKAVAKTMTVAANTVAPATNDEDAVVPAQPVAAKHAKTHTQTATVTGKDAVTTTTGNAKTATTSHVASTKNAGVAVNNKTADKQADMNNMPLASSAASNKAMPVAKTAPITAGMMPTGDKAGNNSAATGTGNNTTPAVAAVTKAPAKVAPVPGINNTKGKKIIEKMTIFQHCLQTEQKAGHLDTVSIVAIAEQLGMTQRTAAAPAGAAGQNAAGNIASANGVAGSAAVVPGAAGTATNAPAAKEAKKSYTSTTTPLETLKNEFNDVKVRVAGIRFAPGLTAGINGTFFGPNSFKGFQFGVTGQLVFNDDLGIMAEFKYIHRINNDYQVNDNYYNYLNNGTKQLMLNSYSFSTLHSLELPISVRYNIGNFTFIAGGNLVYSFAINTGAATIASNTDPIPTSTPASQATDNAPKLNASDFNSRFSIGYLFGFGYRINPNVTLDLRDVQSFWDNAGSQGAKSVSTQLYKSPSFQFSIGYRLGGKKNNR